MPRIFTMSSSFSTYLSLLGISGFVAELDGKITSTKYRFVFVHEKRVNYPLSTLL